MDGFWGLSKAEKVKKLLTDLEEFKKNNNITESNNLTSHTYINNIINGLTTGNYLIKKNDIKNAEKQIEIMKTKYKEPKRREFARSLIPKNLKKV